MTAMPGHAPADAADRPAQPKWPSVLLAVGAWLMGAVVVLAVTVVMELATGEMLDQDRWLLGAEPLAGLTASLLLVATIRKHWWWPAPLVLAFTSVTSWTVPAAVLILLLATRGNPGRAKALVLIGVGGFAAAVSALVVEFNPVIAGCGFLLGVLGAAVPVIGGLWWATRDRLLSSLRDQLETRRQAEQDQDARVRAEERASIARDMHDTLAHHLAIIAVHTGALTHQRSNGTTLDAERTTRSLEVVGDAARAATEDLRQILHTLRASVSEDLGPPHTLSELPAHLSEDHSGHQVDYRTTIDPATIPSAISRQLFRICQESLTNATKHAPGLPVTIRLDRHPTGDNGLLLIIANPVPAKASPGPGARAGLVGMRERAQHLGGTLTTSTEAGRFTVICHIPPSKDRQSAAASSSARRGSRD